MKQLIVIKVLLLFLGISAFIITGCGKKGPPLPPDYPDILPVKAFKGSVTDQILTLSWQKPKGKMNQVLKKYVLYQSRKDIGAETCEKCPVMFQKLAEVPADQTTFTKSLEKGYDYIFKIISVSDANSSSDDSEFVTIRHE